MAPSVFPLYLEVSIRLAQLVLGSFSDGIFRDHYGQELNIVTVLIISCVRQSSRQCLFLLNAVQNAKNLHVQKTDNQKLSKSFMVNMNLHSKTRSLSITELRVSNNFLYKQMFMNCEIHS